jgi:hypothetical protein
MNHDPIQAAVAKASDYNLRLDASLRETGIVDIGLFTDFVSVQADPNASSVGWLEAKLRVLSERLSSGASLSLYDPPERALKIVSGQADLTDWAHRHFPVARWRS